MSDNTQDKIFNLCYEMALRDATLRSAYDGKLADLRTCEEMRNTVKLYIKSIEEKPDSVNVYTVIKKVMNNATISKNKNGEDVEFSYGNAQKLVNMTAKYMYIATYFNDVYKDKFKNCHCPMDSLIVESLIADIKKYKKCDEALVLYKDVTGNKNRAWMSYLREPWSKMDVKQYEFFQELVNMIKMTDEYALEYDYTHWHPKES